MTLLPPEPKATGSNPVGRANQIGRFRRVAHSLLLHKTLRGSPLEGGLQLTLSCQLGLLAGLGGASLGALFWSPAHPSDLWQVWAAVQALNAGQNPYDVVGPGKPFPWPIPLVYPMTAALILSPIAWLPLWATDLAFVGIGSAALAYALTRRTGVHPACWVFASAAYLSAVQGSQWSVLFTAASQLPWLTVVYAAKPTLAAALWIAYPSWQGLLLPLFAGAASVVLWPWWPAAWAEMWSAASYLRAPITFHGGPVLLAALWQWRRSEARLLVALACIPHTTFLYEGVPLFLIVKRAEEGVYLAIATAFVAVLYRGTYPTFEDHLAAAGQWMVWLLYLPCLVMVLRRRTLTSPPAADTE